VTWTAAHIASLVPRPLPESSSPAVYRFQVGYQRNHTIQTSDLSTNPAVEPRKPFLAEEWRVGEWLDTGVLIANPGAKDTPILPSCLLVKSEAEAVAAFLGGLWGRRRRLYDATLWLQPLTREIGETAVIAYPLQDFSAGLRTLIVGEQHRQGESTVTIPILV
jgi:hypothetical protein